MKSLATVILCSGLPCLALAGGAGAQDAAPSAAGDLPSISYDGTHPATLRYGDLTLTLDSAPGADADSRVPVFTGRDHDHVVFSFRVDDAERPEPTSEAHVMRLDAGARLPQIVMTTFTGSAHCCTATKIAIADGPDAWRVIDAELLDGEGYEFADLDGDGANELISVDNGFLYAFDCYACSFAPTRVSKLVEGRIKDVTADPKYRNFLRGKLAEMEKAAREDRKLWRSNGFLGGWVAAKSLVGEVDDAWRRMLASYDRKSDWPLEECMTGGDIDKCPKNKLRQVTFPQALMKLLVKKDYPTPDRGRDRRKR